MSPSLVSILQALRQAYPAYQFYSPERSVALQQIDINQPASSSSLYISTHGAFSFEDASILPKGSMISIPSTEPLANGEITYFVNHQGRYCARWKGECEKTRKPSKMAFLNRNQPQKPAPWGSCESLTLMYAGPPHLKEVNENYFLWFSVLQHTSSPWNDNDNTLSVAVVTIHDLRALGKITKGEHHPTKTSTSA